MRTLAAITASVLLLAAADVSTQNATEPAAGVARVLHDIRANDTGQLAVSEEDGRFLRVLIAASGSKRDRLRCPEG